MDMSRNKEQLNLVITKFLKRKSCYLEDSAWVVKKSSLGDFGVFANRDIQPGEIIFLDYPVLLGPRFLSNLPIQCSICYSKENLISCNKKCYLVVCNSCSASDQHTRECQLLNKLKNNSEVTEKQKEQLTRCLTPLRSLILSKEDVQVVTNLKYHRGSQHGKEIKTLTDELGLEFSEEEQHFLYLVCTVLDANAFEVLTDQDNKNSIRGLFPLAGLTNHRCYPNAFHVFDDQHRMVVRAAVFIKKDEEIFHSYTRLLWGTITRVFHLKNTKHFICECNRCLDATEFGTYMTAITCKKCKGNLLPITSLQTSNWKCEICQCVEHPKVVAKTLSLVGSILKGLSKDDFHLLYNFLKTKLPILMPETNQVALEIKYKIIWILGHKEGYTWKDMSIELLLLKKTFCEDVLKVLEILRLGKCKIRGLLLFELYLCYEEIKLREINNEQKIGKENSEKYLMEAVDILKYDASAPDIIKQKMNQLYGQ